eukprot:g54.t1
MNDAPSRSSLSTKIRRLKPLEKSESHASFNSSPRENSLLRDTLHRRQKNKNHRRILPELNVERPSRPHTANTSDLSESQLRTSLRDSLKESSSKNRPLTTQSAFLAGLDAEALARLKAIPEALLDEKISDETLLLGGKEVTVCEYLDRTRQSFEEFKAEAERLQNYQQVLGEVVQDFEEFEEIEYDLSLKSKLWNGIRDWNKIKAEWLGYGLDEMSMTVQRHFKTAATAARVLNQNPVCMKYQDYVEQFKSLLPVIESLTNTTLKARHWAKIEELVGFQIQGQEDITLGYLIGKDVNKTKVLDVWNNMKFTVLPFKESKDVFILRGVDEVIAALDDGLVTINTILSSRYCGNIRLEVTRLKLPQEVKQFDDIDKGWKTIMRQTEEFPSCLKAGTVSGRKEKLRLYNNQLDKIQKSLEDYLESIFSAPDIQRQLPQEAKQFDDIDKGWKTIMRQTEEFPSCLKAGTVSGRKEKLRLYNNQLDKIQKSLEDYLETKRQAFGCFYFISNDELLAILSQARNPQAVQPFDALVKLDFGTSNKSQDILAMRLGEGERVGLTRNRKACGPVEEWLNNVETAMKKALRKCMKEGMLDYDECPRTKWIKMHPGQVVMTVAQIMWSRTCECVIVKSSQDANAWEEWYKENVNMVRELTLLVRKKIPKIERRVIVALVTTDVHARDIVEEMGELGPFKKEGSNGVHQLSNFIYKINWDYFFLCFEDLTFCFPNIRVIVFFSPPSFFRFATKNYDNNNVPSGGRLNLTKRMKGGGGGND